ncbi:hypothetical protein AN946_03765 [Trueperella pyogenes]|nr:hypothetical protein AN946_03765 [Trueperella pyogenes]
MSAIFTTSTAQPPLPRCPSPNSVSVASQASAAVRADVVGPSVRVRRKTAGLPSLCGGLVHNQS